MERLAQKALTLVWPGAALGLCTGLVMFLLAFGNVRWAIRMWSVPQPLPHSPRETIVYTFMLSMVPGIAMGLVAAAPIRRRFAAPGGIVASSSTAFLCLWFLFLFLSPRDFTQIELGRMENAIMFLVLAVAAALIVGVLAIVPSVAIALLVARARAGRIGMPAIFAGVLVAAIVTTLPTRPWPSREENVVMLLDVQARKSGYTRYEVIAIVEDGAICARIESGTYDDPDTECEVQKIGAGLQLVRCVRAPDEIGTCRELGHYIPPP